jgi:hypothetical protein
MQIYNRKTIYWFVETVMIKGIPKPKTYECIEGNDDRLQCGGDIIFNSKGEVVMKYVEDNAVDRPKIPAVLDFICEKNQ